MQLLKPARLAPGDTVAAVSLSSGAAGLFPHRYRAGKVQLETTFGLNLIAAPNALRDDAWLYRNPEARADSLHWALSNPQVKGIISTIGGYESVRMLPFLDSSLIRQHPKVFMGFSDTTIQHVAFFNAGVVSFYGTSLLTGFAENGGMFPLTVQTVRETLFEGATPVDLPVTPEWTEEFLDFGQPDLQTQLRKRQPNSGWVWLQGEGQAEGHLMGGCMEVLEMLKGTPYWPSLEAWRGAVLYLETSEEVPPPSQVEYWLRNYATQGIVPELATILFARPMSYTPEMTEKLYTGIKKVLWECGREDMPVVANMDFGHTSPTFILPNGCRTRVDAAAKRVTLLEAGVA